ncbi:MAG: hypothetical protein WBB04_10030, partial [Candidatus Macondimonas sp.]
MAAYRESFRDELAPGQVDELRWAAPGNFAPGKESSRRRRQRPWEGGRSRKPVEPKSSNPFLHNGKPGVCPWFPLYRAESLSRKVPRSCGPTRAKPIASA